MGRLLVVDGSDVCRAPIAEHLLRQALQPADAFASAEVLSRGITAEGGRTMCDSAASRLGFTGPAIAFYGAHRSAQLTVADIAGADLVLTAERAQRSAVVRMLPGTQATVFTWKEALVLSSVLVDRRRSGALRAQPDLAALARALHGARGTVPLIEPPTRTGPFHWRRAQQEDPLTIVSGHEGAAEHRRVTQETADVVAALGSRFGLLAREHEPEAEIDAGAVGTRRLRRSA